MNKYSYNVEKTLYLVLILIVQYYTISPIFFDEVVLLSSYTDDFYYYIQIAKNIVLGNGSTFNGIVQTNGYHPLWLIILTILVKVSLYFNFELLIFIKIIISIILFFSFFLIYKFAEQYITNRLWRISFILLSYYWYSKFACYGMEITITIPLFLIFLFAYLNDKNALYLSLLASLIILSRLDAIVIFIILFGFEIFYKGIDTKRLLRIGIGMLPIVVYVISNIYFFDILVPISGMAKSVIEITSFHTELLTSLFVMTKFKIMFIFFYVFTIFNFKKIKNASVNIKIFFYTAILSLPIYYLQTSLRSDWPIWHWYWYPFIISFFMMGPVLDYIFSKFEIKLPKIIQNILFYMIIFYTVILFLNMFKAIHSYSPLHMAGMKISNFEKKNPGIYAMGDRAGIVGFLIKSPLVQLEGLVMDKKYLDLLEEKDSIEEVLNEYNVDYYIGTDLKKLQNDCYMIVEPVQSSGYSRQIKSELCWKEVLKFKIGNVSTFILQR